MLGSKTERELTDRDTSCHQLSDQRRDNEPVARIIMLDNKTARVEAQRGSHNAYRSENAYERLKAVPNILRRD